MILIRSFLLSKSRRSRIRHSLVPLLWEDFGKIPISDLHHPSSIRILATFGCGPIGVKSGNPILGSWEPSGNIWEHLGTPLGTPPGLKIDDLGELEWSNRAETIATCGTRGISILATFGRGPVSESGPTTAQPCF